MTGGELTIIKRKYNSRNEVFQPQFFRYFMETSQWTYNTNKLGSFLIVGTLGLKELANIKSAK